MCLYIYIFYFFAFPFWFFLILCIHKQWLVQFSMAHCVGQQQSEVAWNQYVDRVMYNLITFYESNIKNRALRYLSFELCTHEFLLCHAKCHNIFICRLYTFPLNDGNASIGQMKPTAQRNANTANGTLLICQSVFIYVHCMFYIIPINSFWKPSLIH